MQIQTDDERQTSASAQMIDIPDVSLCIYPYDFRVRDFREADHELHTPDDACDTYCQNGGDCLRNATPYFWWDPGSFFVLTTLPPTAKF